MKIVAKNKNIKSMQLNVPIDGCIEINENGIAEVSRSCGEMLINGTLDWKEFSDEEDTDESAKEPEQGNNDGNQESEKDSDAVSNEEIIEGLKKLSLEECIATAKEANYPEKEWEKLAKNEKAAEKLMRQYLVKKFKESLK